MSLANGGEREQEKGLKRRQETVHCVDSDIQWVGTSTLRSRQLVDA